MEMRDKETLVDGAQDQEILADEAQEDEESLLDLLGMRDKSDEDLNMMRTLAKKGDQRALLWMGLYYMRDEEEDRDFAEACYWFNKCDDATAKVYMAQTYEKEGNKELALKYYQEAVEAQADSAGTMKGMAWLSLTMGFLSRDIHKAEDSFIQLLKSDLSEELEANIPAISDVLGRRLMLEKDYEAAILWTRFFLNFEPDDEKAKKRLFMLSKEGLKAEEESAFRKNALEGMEYLRNAGDRLALAYMQAPDDTGEMSGQTKEDKAGEVSGQTKAGSVREPASQKKGFWSRLFKR